MNIFAFDPSPWQSALWLDDVRKNKMILETTQLLSTAIRKLDPFTELDVYQPTHRFHPCTKWVADSRGNFKWTLKYVKALGEQRDKPHVSLRLLPLFEGYVDTGFFYLEGQTPFANCARNVSQGLDFTDEQCVHTAYKKYINERWKKDTISLSWNYGEQPEWKLN